MRELFLIFYFSSKHPCTKKKSKDWEKINIEPKDWEYENETVLIIFLYLYVFSLICILYYYITFNISCKRYHIFVHKSIKSIEAIMNDVSCHLASD